MIKKYMNQLYKEFVQIRRKIDGGHMKYFGQKDYLNAFEYLIILKNGSYFRITLGTRFIPNIKKKDIAFAHQSVKNGIITLSILIPIEVEQDTNGINTIRTFQNLNMLPEINIGLTYTPNLTPEHGIKERFM